MRQGALARVNQQKNAIHHLQRPLDFAAEVAVTGGVDNVDLHSLITNTGRLGENRDSALALESIRVEDTFHNLFIGPENAALPQHGIYQSRLSVIDVSDDRYVTNSIVRHNEPS